MNQAPYRYGYPRYHKRWVSIIPYDSYASTLVNGFYRRSQKRFERRNKTIKNYKFPKPSQTRYNERTNVERVNGRLKGEFGGKTVRVRGTAKILTHLMFGILALTADQLFRLIS